MKCVGHEQKIDHIRRPEKYKCLRAAFANNARYKVEVSGYGGGYCKWFNLLRRAESYFETARHAGPLVQLLDMWFHHEGCNCWNTPGFLLKEQDNRDSMPRPETCPLSAERTRELAHVIWPKPPEISFSS